MMEISRTIDLDDDPHHRIVINAAEGSNVTVNVDVKHYRYPEWLDEAIKKRIMEMYSEGKI